MGRIKQVIAEYPLYLIPNKTDVCLALMDVFIAKIVIPA
jgi:hypothetical protein